MKHIHFKSVSRQL